MMTLDKDGKEVQPYRRLTPCIAAATGLICIIISAPFPNHEFLLAVMCFIERSLMAFESYFLTHNLQGSPVSISTISICLTSGFLAFIGIALKDHCLEVSLTLFLNSL